MNRVDVSDSSCLWYAPLGMVPVGASDNSPEGYLPWVNVIGIALLALVFLLASTVSVRNRKYAGLIFLSAWPVGSFLLAYPQSGTLVWHADGSGWMETPLFSTALWLTGAFFLPFLAALMERHHRKRAVYAFVVAAAFAIVVFSISRWTLGLVPRLVGWSVLFLPFGLFWLRTGERGWPSLVQGRPSSLARRILIVAATGCGILCLGVVFTVLLCGLTTSLASGDCRGKPPFLRPQYPTQAVFTAKVLYAGRSISSLLRIREGWGWGDWAIGVVQEEFWGMPRWTHLVLLTNYVYWEGETYFVDGRRLNGWLTQFLPIVEGGIGCSRTKLAQNSIVDLRLLRKPPPAGKTRAMGYVRTPETFTSVFERPSKPTFVAGAQIAVIGPTDSRTVMTDSGGIYELDDLPPGDYTLRLSMPETQSEGFWNRDGSPAKIHMDSGGVVERNFELFWEGRIEGLVKDDSGRPAHVWVQLVSADERRIPGYVDFFQMTAKDGSYRFQKVPPGRYMIELNPQGPDGESPYELQYFPSGVRKSAARVFELAPGQRVTGVDFQTQLLAARNTRVRVTWANGTVAAGASVCFAYENADGYDTLQGRNCSKTTDQNGIAVLATYGRSQVRVFGTSSSFHSQSVQIAADQTPNSINLVLTSAKH